MFEFRTKRIDSVYLKPFGILEKCLHFTVGEKNKHLCEGYCGRAVSVLLIDTQCFRVDHQPSFLSFEKRVLTLKRLEDFETIGDIEIFEHAKRGHVNAIAKLLDGRNFSFRYSSDHFQLFKPISWYSVFQVDNYNGGIVEFRGEDFGQVHVQNLSDPLTIALGLFVRERLERMRLEID